MFLSAGQDAQQDTCSGSKADRGEGTLTHPVFGIRAGAVEFLDRARRLVGNALLDVFTEMRSRRFDRRSEIARSVFCIAKILLHRASDDGLVIFPVCTGRGSG